MSSSYVRDPTVLSSPWREGWWAEAMDELTQVTDLQAVVDASGAGTLAMVHKQLKSIGCPTWDDLIARHERSEVMDNDIHIWISIADCGPDQVLAQKILNARLLAVPSCIVLGSKCYQHQAQLIVSASARSHTQAPSFNPNN